MKLLVDTGNMDLHIISRYSGGFLSPNQIIRHAGNCGPAVISITDYDTMGEYRFIDKKELEQSGVTIIPGVQMICLYGDSMVDVLGYEINPNLFQLLKKVYYKKYPGHNNKHITFKNASKLIHLLGGKVVLAHPYRSRANSIVGEELVKKAIADNLIDGIECFHSFHTKEETETLLKYANEYDLYVTAGSNYSCFGKKVRGDMAVTDIGHLATMNQTIEDCINSYKTINKSNNK